MYVAPLDRDLKFCGVTDDRATVVAHLRQVSGACACYDTLDATLSHHRDVWLWLDADGDLVQTHPTDPKRTCTPPTDVSIRLYR